MSVNFRRWIWRLGGVIWIQAALCCLVHCDSSPAVAQSSLDENWYAALAYSDSTRSWGYSYGYASQEEAEKEAIRRCNASDARVLTWARNQWICFARASNSGYGYSSAATAEEAQAEAVQHCANRGGGCQVLVLVYANHNALKPARIKVWVPNENAHLYVNGQLVSGTGVMRSLNTAKLVPGKKVDYQFSTTYTEASGSTYQLKLTAPVQNDRLTQIVFNPAQNPQAFYKLVHPVQETIGRPSGSPDSDIPDLPLFAP